MIEVTRLNGTSIYVNPDMIRSIEMMPDTLLLFSDSTRLVVRETPDELIDRVVEYRRRTYHVPPMYRGAREVAES